MKYPNCEECKYLLPITLILQGSYSSKVASKKFEVYEVNLSYSNVGTVFPQLEKRNHRERHLWNNNIEKLGKKKKPVHDIPL